MRDYSGRKLRRFFDARGAWTLGALSPEDMMRSRACVSLSLPGNRISHIMRYDSYENYEFKGSSRLTHITTSYLEYSMILLTSANERCRLVGSTIVIHDHLSNPGQARRPSVRPQDIYYITKSEKFISARIPPGPLDQHDSAHSAVSAYVQPFPLVQQLLSAQPARFSK